jgi:hypothetical protein
MRETITITRVEQRRALVSRGSTRRSAVRQSWPGFASAARAARPSGSRGRAAPPPRRLNPHLLSPSSKQMRAFARGHTLVHVPARPGPPRRSFPGRRSGLDRIRCRTSPHRQRASRSTRNQCRRRPGAGLTRFGEAAALARSALVSTLGAMTVSVPPTNRGWRPGANELVCRRRRRRECERPERTSHQTRNREDG